MTKLSVPAHLYSLHSRNPHFPKERANLCQRATQCSKDHLFGGPWVNACPWLPQILHNRGESPSWAFLSEALQNPHQRSGCPQIERNTEIPHQVLLSPKNTCSSWDPTDGENKHHLLVYLIKNTTITKDLNSIWKCISICNIWTK